MEKIIVYVDDAACAQQQLAAMKSRAALTAGGTHWVLVACAPRMTRRISKWVSHSARESWRERWAEKLFGQIVPPLREAGDGVTTVLATGPLPALTRELTAQHGATQVLDARRPKFGQELPAATADQPVGQEGRGQVPGAVIAMGAFLVLAAE